MARVLALMSTDFFQIWYKIRATEDTTELPP